MHEHKGAISLRPVGLDKLWISLKHQQLRAHVQNAQIRGNRTLDFRPDHQAVVIFPPWRYRHEARTILQLIKVGDMDAAAILGLVDAFVVGDPLDVALYRIDLTVDVVGHTMLDWRNSISIARKRLSSEFSDFSIGSFRKSQFQTLYFGARNRDQLKLYDKEMQLKKVCKFKGPLPSPFVRIERTFAKEAMPEEIATLGRLLLNAPSFDPFMEMTVHPTPVVSPERLFDVQGFKLNERQNAAWALHNIEQYGLQEARKRMAAEHRVPDRLIKLINEMAGSVLKLPTSRELVELFQKSFSAQMFPQEAAPATCLPITI